MTYSKDDFAPGSDERVEAVMASAGALCNAHDVVEDWGDYDEDHTANDKARSWENTDVDAPVDITFTAADKFNDLFYND
jgi:hypothetical protein